MKRILHYTVGDDYAGEKIHTLLCRHYKMSSNLITALKRYPDGICVNHTHQRVTYLLKKHDIVTITMHEDSSETIVSTKLPLDIIYEDEDIAVINKPPNMPTHPSAGNYENTLANGLMYYWRSKGCEHVFRAVNRLDKNTSGLILIAKNAYTHARLCTQMTDGILKRKYNAIVCGTPDTCGTVNAPIARMDKSIIKRCVDPSGQYAVTQYQTLKHLNGYTLLLLQLETGRTHQIRVHMSYIGCPLVGDFLYGEENHTLLSRQALHSCYAEFIHPITQKKMTFTQELPQDMQDFIEKNVKNS